MLLALTTLKVKCLGAKVLRDACSSLNSVFRQQGAACALCLEIWGFPQRTSPLGSHCHGPPTLHCKNEKPMGDPFLRKSQCF